MPSVVVDAIPIVAVGSEGRKEGNDAGMWVRTAVEGLDNVIMLCGQASRRRRGMRRR